MIVFVFINEMEIGFESQLSFKQNRRKTHETILINCNHTRVGIATIVHFAICLFIWITAQFSEHTTAEQSMVLLHPQ